jgi:hypothetical protein
MVGTPDLKAGNILHMTNNYQQFLHKAATQLKVGYVPVFEMQMSREKLTNIPSCEAPEHNVFNSDQLNETCTF